MTDPAYRFCDNCAHAQVMDMTQGHTESYRCDHPTIRLLRGQDEVPDWLIDKNEFQVRSHGQHCSAWKDEIHRDLDQLIAQLERLAKKTALLNPDDSIRFELISDSLNMVKQHILAAKKIQESNIS